MEELEASIDLDITPERRREIDEILMENYKKYMNGEIKERPLKEFLKENSRIVFNLWEQAVI